MLFYEYIVTFAQEYRYIWHAKRWSAVRIAFLINRYCAIVEFTFFLVNNFSGMSDATCARVSRPYAGHAQTAVALPVCFCRSAMSVLTLHRSVARRGNSNDQVHFLPQMLATCTVRSAVDSHRLAIGVHVYNEIKGCLTYCAPHHLQLLATFTIQALRVHAIWNRHMAVIIALGLDIVLFVG